MATQLSVISLRRWRGETGSIEQTFFNGDNNVIFFSVKQEVL